MINSQVSKLLALANHFVLKLADEKETAVLEETHNINKRFEAQREFSRQFDKQLRALIGELSGDLYTLKERKFDPNMWKLAVKIRSGLETILTEIRENNPHEMGWKFVDYVLDKPNSDILDNLNFLVQHHLDNTKPTTIKPLPSIIKHVEINSFKHIKALAQEIKNYMEKNPPMPVPASNPPPPEPNPMADPSFLASPDVATKV